MKNVIHILGRPVYILQISFQYQHYIFCLREETSEENATTIGTHECKTQCSLLKSAMLVRMLVTASAVLLKLQRRPQKISDYFKEKLSFFICGLAN